MIADYYLAKKDTLVLDDLYDGSVRNAYPYKNGFHLEAISALGLASVFSVSSVWVPVLGFLGGFDWIIGAALGAVLYLVFLKWFPSVSFRQ